LKIRRKIATRRLVLTNATAPRARTKQNARAREPRRDEGEGSAIFAAIYFATAAIYSAVSAADRCQLPRRDCSFSPSIVTRPFIIVRDGRALRGRKIKINNQRDSVSAPFFGD